MLLANAILRGVSTIFAWPWRDRAPRCHARKIVAAAGMFSPALDDKMGSNCRGRIEQERAMATATLRRERHERRGVPQTGLAARLAIRRNEHSGPTRAWRRASCRPISPSCRKRWPRIFCASASSIQSRVRWSASRRRAIGALPALGRRPRYPHRPAALSGLARRRARRRADRPHALVARRSRHLRHRLLVLVRAGVDRRRHRAAPHDLQLHRADVPHLDRNDAGGSVPRAAGRFDAADEAGRRHPRRADHDAISFGARRAGASRQAGS